MSEYIITTEQLNWFLERIDETDVIPSAIVLTHLKPIVRCRDCKHAFEADRGLFDCIGPLTTSWDYWNDDFKENLVEPDGFCAWGERKVVKE